MTGGKPAIAPASALTVPADVAPAVLGITGLDTTPVAMVSDTLQRPGQPAATAAPPVVSQCSAYFGQKLATSLPPAYGRTVPWRVCGYTPGQLRSAYGVAGSGLTGKGVTVAIITENASPTIVTDVNTYVRDHGGKPLAPGQFTDYRPANLASTCQPPDTVFPEESLDTEAVHTMAPDAKIAHVAVVCNNRVTGPLDALTTVVDSRLADIVSNSYHLSRWDRE